MATLLPHISVRVKWGVHELLKTPHSTVHALLHLKWGHLANGVSLCSTVVVQPLIALPFLRTFYSCGDHARKVANTQYMFSPLEMWMTSMTWWMTFPSRMKLQRRSAALFPHPLDSTRKLMMWEDVECIMLMEICQLYPPPVLPPLLGWFACRVGRAWTGGTGEGPPWGRNSLRAHCRYPWWTPWSP